MYVAGIDSGSIAMKGLIMGDNDQVLSFVVEENDPDIETLSWKVLNRALDEARLKKEDLSFIVATGANRHIIPFAKDNRTDVMCHALAIHHLFPAARTVFDIGGQDSKAIRITDIGRVKQFVMNERCAAGTGRFAEVMAQALEIPFEKWREVVASATDRAKISSYCTIFAESEAISLMSTRAPISEILAGLCDAMVTRVTQMALKLGEIEKEVAFTGGVALNGGIATVLSEKLGVNLLIPENPQATGALGAAFLAKRFATEAK